MLVKRWASLYCGTYVLSTTYLPAYVFYICVACLTSTYKSSFLRTNVPKRSSSSTEFMYFIAGSSESELHYQHRLPRNNMRIVYICTYSSKLNPMHLLHAIPFFKKAFEIGHCLLSIVYIFCIFGFLRLGPVLGLDSGSGFWNGNVARKSSKA